MMFNSISFMFFLPIVFTIYWLLSGRNRTKQNLFIVAASYIFYGIWDWRFLILIAFTTMCSWWSGVLLNKFREVTYKTQAKWIAGTNIAINLAILGAFKYYNFFATSFAELFNFAKDDIVMLNVILPVGISFYTFQALSYTIDVYRQKIEPTQDAIAFFAFVSFFPQLVAGPIERATNLLPQFLKDREFNYDEAVDGCRRMLWGFFKKLVIADNCAMYVNWVWDSDLVQNGSTLALAAVLFSFQIYGDFSGYSDIAIGCSKLFGISLRDNFISPYFSRDVAEFWKRWHISLNTWFVDYVYIPLGGSREGKAKKIRNTFVIFLLSGLWHGANWTYVAWGLYHALLFVPLVITGKSRKHVDSASDVKDIIYIPLTFILVTFGWIVFRAPSITEAWIFFRNIWTNGLFEDPSSWGMARDCIWAILFALLVEWFQRKRRHGLDLSFIRPWWIKLLICYGIMLYVICFSGQNVTFIYFQF